MAEKSIKLEADPCNPLYTKEYATVGTAHGKRLHYLDVDIIKTLEKKGLRKWF